MQVYFVAFLTDVFARKTIQNTWEKMGPIACCALHGSSNQENSLINTWCVCICLYPWEVYALSRPQQVGYDVWSSFRWAGIDVSCLVWLCCGLSWVQLVAIVSQITAIKEVIS